jgi:hypothetical protein
VLYRAAISIVGADPASHFEETFERNGWPPQWRESVYDPNHPTKSVCSRLQQILKSGYPPSILHPALRPFDGPRIDRSGCAEAFSHLATFASTFDLRLLFHPEALLLLAALALSFAFGSPFPGLPYKGTDISSGTKQSKQGFRSGAGGCGILARHELAV